MTELNAEKKMFHRIDVLKVTQNRVIFNVVICDREGRDLLVFYEYSLGADQSMVLKNPLDTEQFAKTMALALDER